MRNPSAHHKITSSSTTCSSSSSYIYRGAYTTGKRWLSSVNGQLNAAWKKGGGGAGGNRRNRNNNNGSGNNNNNNGNRDRRRPVLRSANDNPEFSKLRRLNLGPSATGGALGKLSGGKASGAATAASGGEEKDEEWMSKHDPGHTERLMDHSVESIDFLQGISKDFTPRMKITQADSEREEMFARRQKQTAKMEKEVGKKIEPIRDEFLGVMGVEYYLDGKRWMEHDLRIDLEDPNVRRRKLEDTPEKQLERTRALMDESRAKIDALFEDEESTANDIADLAGMKLLIIEVRNLRLMRAIGRVMSIATLVAVGNGKGALGIGIGRGESLPEAAKKAARKAVRAVEYYERYDQRTIHHPVQAKSGKCKVFLRPAREEFGLVTHTYITQLSKLIGIRDLSGNVVGSTRNTLNLVRAYLDALKKQRTPQMLAKETGRNVFAVKSEQDIKLYKVVDPKKFKNYRKW
eukprot:Nk52_evm17s316 gene=Nk52_evmTU17s316